jgi:hypothetical protein
MKKLIVLAVSCAAAISAVALPTYEPFTEYNALVAANPTNSIDLCTSGLFAPSGEPWLNWSFSGTTGTNLQGLDIQVTNWAASVFTSNSLSTFLPTNFPGFPSFGNSITTIVINPAQPFVAGVVSPNIVGNSAVLQFAQDFVRPATGTKTLFVSYLFAVAQQGQTGSGNIGRYLDFVAATNIVEGANTTGFYKTWQPLNNTFGVNTGPRYFGHGVFAPSNFDLEPDDSGAGKTALPSYTVDPVSFNTPYLVIGEFSFVSTNASVAGTKDTNTIWVNPPLTALGGLIPTNLVTNVDTMVITMNDVDGMVLLDRPGSGQSGGVGTNYIANLMLGGTWSYVTGGPEFTNPPVPVVTNYGSTITLSGSATAAGQTISSYQWQKLTANGVINVTNGAGGAGGGATATGATTTTLTLTGLSAADFGTYQLVATASGTGYSLAAPVTVTADPLISVQPQSAVVFPGNTATVSVTASTQFGSLSYQWFLNGAPLANGTLADGSIISGVTNSTLTITNFQADESGDIFTVAVTNSLPTGEISLAAVLTASSDPAVLTQPNSVTTNYGATATFTASAQTANAHAPITYAWYHGSTMLVNGAQSDGSVAVNAQGTNAGATLTATLTLSNVSFLDDGSYSLIVTNGVNGTASSTPATLTVIDPYIGVQPPATVEMPLGGTNSITVGGAGVGLTYQWYSAAAGQLSNGGDLSGVNTSNLVISGAQLSDAGTYYVILSGANGSIQSSNVTVIVDTAVTGVTLSPPSLTQQVGTHLALVGGVAGGNGGNLNEFWQFNGTNLANGTQANKTVVSGVGTTTLVLSNLQTASSGTYTLIATNAAGGVTASSIIKVSASLLGLSVTNLEVTRVGEGSEPLSGATGNTLYLDQFTTNGAYVSTIMVPDNGTSPLLVPGAGSDGQNEAYMTLSSNKAYLNFTGYFYNYPFSGADVTIGGTAAVRGIGAVNALGYYVLAYTNNGLYSGGEHFIRDAYSTDGLTNFWTTGAAGSAAIKYVNAGPAGAAYATGSGIPGLSSAVVGPRSLGLLGTNLVFSDNGDAIAGIDQFTGAPMISGTSINILSTGSPADFAFSPDSNTVYTADDSQSIPGGTGFGGGIQRWDLVSGFYTYAYNLEDTTGIGTGQTNGIRGLTVYFPTNITTWGQGVTNAVIYATTSETVSNRLIQFVDNGLNSTATVLATAGPNQFLRGVRFGPAVLPISILTAPQGATVFSGNSDTLSVGVVGDAPIFYQWQFDGTNIVNATNSSLSLANIQATNSGTYTVIVTNAASSNGASAVVSVTTSGPLVLVPPQSRVETVGDHLAFTISANGTQPIHYQWQSNGVAIAGATTSAYSLTNILQSYSATYSVVATNVLGTNTNSATLTVTTNLQSLSSNNIVVARIGDGVEALSSTTGDTLYLDQLTPAGVYSNTIMIPDNSSAGNMIVSGGTTEGPQAAVLNLSANNVNNALNSSNFLNFAGFATPYPATNALGGEVVPRAVGSVNAFGFYARPMTPLTLYDSAVDVFDSVVSLDGLTAFWTTGVAGAPPAVKYVTPATAGTAGGIVSIAGTAQGTRVVNIVGGNLVYSDQQSIPPGIFAVSGLPTGAGTAVNIISDAAGAPNDFAASPDTTSYPPSTSTYYVADSSAISAGGGIQRYDWNGTAYALTYTLGTGAGSTAGASGLTVNFSASATWGSNVTGAVIFATTTGNPGNALIKIVDTGSNSIATVLETANPNQILRGVRFGPVQGPPVFASQPIPTNAFVGGVSIFSTVVQNGPIIGYQWQLNGVNLTNGPSASGSGAIISGATNATLTISNVGALDDQGNYTLVATNLFGSAGSQSASLIVPVNIVTYPAAFQNITNGGTATFTVVATGGLPLTYQWSGPCGSLTDGADPCNNGGIISGSSTATLTISNAGAADSGSYTVFVNNPEGSTNNQAQPAVLSVYSGPPQILTDIQPTSLVIPVGYNASFTATVIGTTPLAYQWQVNGSNLTDNGHVSGSQTSTLTIPNAQLSDSGNYQLTITNGAGSNHTSSASLTVTLIGFNNGVGWTTKGTGSINNGSLSLTLGAANQTTSAFLSDPVDVLGFLATWTYQDVGGAGADGTAFVLQNSAQGTAALGAGGGDLGYVGISNSIAFEFNIYSPNSVGVAIGTNGFGKGGTTATAGGPYGPTSPVNIASGDPIGVSLQYLNGVATLTLTDTVTSVTYTTNYHVNVPAFVGSNTAYVGFTGAAGAVASSQTVSNFFFTSLPAVAIQQGVTGSLTFTWPVAAAGFQLQQVSDLTITNWVNVTNPPTVTNGQNQITITPVSTNEFYRLIIQ